MKKPPRTNSLREKGKHKSGGQPGHKGETLKQVETPDIIIRGFINTMRKQGSNILKAIQSIFSGDIMLAAGCSF